MNHPKQNNLLIASISEAYSCYLYRKNETLFHQSEFIMRTFNVLIILGLLIAALNFDGVTAVSSADPTFQTQGRKYTFKIRNEKVKFSIVEIEPV